MPAELSPTSYALLGLLMLGDSTDNAGLTGYELKLRADRTLRFYWVSPAMSQVYSELARLARRGHLTADHDRAGRRTTRRYRINESGVRALRSWLSAAPVDFPVLKHPVAMRLMMGQLLGEQAAGELLDSYRQGLADRRADLQAVRDSLGDPPALRYPAMVAEWGLAYYDSERDIVDRLIRGLRNNAE